MTIGIYSLVNQVNGKRYIGKSKKTEHRIWSHFNLLKKETPSRNVNRHLFAAAKKYGVENFSWEIVESFDWSVDYSFYITEARKLIDVLK